jgi:hypothetical protein
MLPIEVSFLLGRQRNTMLNVFFVFIQVTFKFLNMVGSATDNLKSDYSACDSYSNPHQIISGFTYYFLLNDLYLYERI